MSRPRRSGVVLHPSSLPGPYGVGDLGPAAYRFLERLQEAGSGIWQVMPLGPTGYGDSPYQCFSAFAGNPLLVSPELLLEEGLLEPADLEGAPAWPEDRVEYCDVIPWKQGLLARAYEHFQERASPWQRERLERFTRAPTRRVWLEDYALFRALKDHHGGAEWARWEPGLRSRDPQALETARRSLAAPMARHEFAQWLFFEQWGRLRQHATDLGLEILGDVPIFVAHDSADAWAEQAEFHFDDEGKPTVVAGVPPDYFSPTGQRWGNPLYRWEAMEATGFDWWIRRMQAAFQLYHMVRLDHFRGFQAYWEVPASEPTAMNGRWVEAPGEALFDALRGALGEVPIVAEDLGLITPEVLELRDQFGFPGMKILQFAFGGDGDHEYLPHNTIPNSVVYTGTHDNDTTLGWYEKASERERHQARRYMGRDGRDLCWDMIRLALASVAETALVPLQDLLGVGSEGRMNTPGRESGNWSWRYREAELTGDVLTRFAELNSLYGRR